MVVYRSFVHMFWRLQSTALALDLREIRLEMVVVVVIVVLIVVVVVVAIVVVAVIVAVWFRKASLFIQEGMFHTFVVHSVELIWSLLLFFVDWDLVVFNNIFCKILFLVV